MDLTFIPHNHCDWLMFASVCSAKAQKNLPWCKKYKGPFFAIWDLSYVWLMTNQQFEKYYCHTKYLHKIHTRCVKAFLVLLNHMHEHTNTKSISSWKSNYRKLKHKKCNISDVDPASFPHVECAMSTQWGSGWSDCPGTFPSLNTFDSIKAWHRKLC